MKEKENFDSVLRDVFIRLSGAVRGGLVQMDLDSDSRADRCMDFWTRVRSFWRRERKADIWSQVEDGMIDLSFDW